MTFSTMRSLLSPGNYRLSQGAPAAIGAPPERLEGAVGESTLVFETGEVGRLASGAVMLRDGGTVVYATCSFAKDPMESVSFTPLTVEYTEKASAGGLTSGSFNKRERRRDFETLVARLVDRPIRPMVPEGWAHDTQLLNWVMSFDGQRLAEPLAITASGAALALSEVPMAQTVAGVRVGLLGDGTYVVNPSRAQMKGSKLDLVLAGTANAILMIEGFADFATDEEMAEAVRVGSEAVADICVAVSAWAAEVGKPKKVDGVVRNDAAAEVLERARAECYAEVVEAFKISLKKERGIAISGIYARLLEALGDAYPEAEVGKAFKALNSAAMRAILLEDGRRSDGRGTDDVRPIASRAAVLPMTHGSALFTRGETQALAVATLGTRADALRMEDLESMQEEDRFKRFYLQYYFPPSSVGETGRVGAPNRREVGHGNLAERALAPIVPSEADFPYVVRVESTITMSNGSSSMASVCGGCLAMMDAGVPVARPIAGVAMGLVLTEDGRAVVLTDILGSEDALGDMDFKVAGDAEGITAFQMDIKVEGITAAIVKEALAKARAGRAHILGEMAKCDPAPGGRLSSAVPKIKSVIVDPKKLGIIIGPKGATINGLIEKYGLQTIDCDRDSKIPGLVQVVGKDEAQVDRALEHIRGMVEVPEVGKIYRNCKVLTVKEFGCFVEILPGKDALCHISELQPTRTQKVEDVCKVGDAIDVMVLEEKGGKVRVSRKAALKEEGVEA